MAGKTNCVVNGTPYFRIYRTVGHKLNENGEEVLVRKAFYGKNQKDAETKFQEYMFKQTQDFDGSKQYFGVLADKWIYNFLINDSKLKDRTKELYIGQWKRYVVNSDLYTMQLDRITASIIQEFYNTVDAPDSAVKAIDKVMKRFYTYLEKEGITRNLTPALVLPKTKKTVTKDNNKVVVWTDEEIKTILNSFDKAQSQFRLKFLLILAYNSGCRIAELLGLKYEDIEDGFISINKQAINRATISRNGQNTYKMDLDPPKSMSSYKMIPINDEVKKQLEIHKEWQKADMEKHGYTTDFIFTSEKGTLYDRQNVSRSCRRYYARIGVDYKSFHTYRHTFGTNLCKRGVAIQVASSLLGHNDIRDTMKYYVNIDLQDKIAAVNCLSGVIEE